MNDTVKQGAAIRPAPYDETPPQEHLVTINELCRRFHVSRTTVWQLRRAGKLPAVHVGRLVRFREADIRRFLDQAGVHTNPA